MNWIDLSIIAATIIKGKLALFGGDPVFNGPLNRYNSIGDEELKAATDVCNRCTLSFLGDWKDIPNVTVFMVELRLESLKVQ